ncbi:MAG TPA: nitrogen fixation protein NifX [Polyangiales bacterium]
MTARTLTLVEDPADVSGRTERLRIAVASQDGKSLDAHFGSARKLCIYDVTASECCLRAVADFDLGADESGEHNVDEEDRIAPRIRALAGCDLLFVLAIGAPVAARVVKADIHPIKVSAAEPMSAVVSKVQAVLTGTPAPWLRKVLNRRRLRSMSFLEQEDEP